MEEIKFTACLNLNQWFSICGYFKTFFEVVQTVKYGRMDIKIRDVLGVGNYKNVARRPAMCMSDVYKRNFFEKKRNKIMNKY